MARRKMTKADGRAWTARWNLVNETQRDELRGTPAVVKLRQLASLMIMARQLGWTEALAEDKARIWERWKKLRKAYGV